MAENPMNENEGTEPGAVADKSLSSTLEWCEYCKTEHAPDKDICAEERLRRRRAFMPDYNRRLEEWLS